MAPVDSAVIETKNNMKSTILNDVVVSESVVTPVSDETKESKTFIQLKETHTFLLKERLI